MENVGFIGQAGECSLWERAWCWALLGFVCSSPLGYIYPKLNFTDTRLNINVFFFLGQVHVRNKMKPQSLKLWLSTIMKGFGGL